MGKKKRERGNEKGMGKGKNVGKKWGKWGDEEEMGKEKITLGRGDEE